MLLPCVLVVAAAPAAALGQGSLTGIIRDFSSGEGVASAEVELVGTSYTANSDGQGAYRIPALPAGRYTVQIHRIGYRAARVDSVDVGDRSARLDVHLDRAAVPLGMVVVTPGVFGVMGEPLAAPRTLTRAEIETRPQLGEDIYRAINRLPGIASSDFSAKFRVRGGANQELLVLLDGMELYEPFHLKDLDGALSIVDVNAVSGVDLTTGGFTAEYGDRLTGVFDLRTDAPPPDRVRTTAGLSVSNLRLTNRGGFARGTGQWMISVRRGYLDVALKFVPREGQTYDIAPHYYDVLAKVEQTFGSTHTLSAHVLQAGDNLTYRELPQPGMRLNSAYDNTYAWLTWHWAPGSGLSARTLASASRLRWNRQGWDALSSGTRSLFVNDDRGLDVLGLKHEWKADLSERWLLKAGVDAKRVSADYDYLNWQRISVLSNGRIRVRYDTTRASLYPDGTTVGAYAAQRVRVGPLIAEAGVRYDRQSYVPGSEANWSPRVSVAAALGPRTTVRAAWGRYFQSEGLAEVQVQDGVSAFAPAELAEHRVLGVEQSVGGWLNLRLEAYDRRLSRARPRYVNLEGGIDFFPETARDRALQAPTAGDAKGFELFARRLGEAHLDWSASYALAWARDVVDGTAVPRPLDQRHTIYLDLSYRVGSAWHVSWAWQYHTGWPYTERTYTTALLRNGSYAVIRDYGPYNSGRLAPYHRLDFRITRSFAFGRSRLAVFADIFNAYNRENPGGYAYTAIVNPDGTVGVRRALDTQLPRIPSLGVTWEF